jgi:hypothetical protein
LYNNYRITFTYYDNVSIIKDWLSDVLCRAAIGTGFSKRTLYSDDDDTLYEFICSIGISAIHLPGSKPDMLDRPIIAKFSFIRKDLRRKKEGGHTTNIQQVKTSTLGIHL